MTGDLIVMAKAQFTYAIGLVSDPWSPRNKHEATYNNALSMLTDFLSAHDGEYLGPFQQDFKSYPEYAVVKMTRAAEDALQDLNANALHDPDESPFLRRLEGEFFDICDADGMEVGICTINRRIMLGQPI